MTADPPGDPLVACSEDGRILVAAGWASAPVDVRGRLRECLDPGHGGAWWTRHRCARCGGPVVDRRRGGTVARAYRAVYCSTRCRVAALRARRRRAAAPA